MLLYRNSDAAPIPVLQLPGLAGRHLHVAGAVREPIGRHRRRDLGGDGQPRGAGVPGDRRSGIFKTAATIRAGVDSIPELEVIGDPTFLVAFRAPSARHLSRQRLTSSRRAGGLNALQLPARAAFLRDPAQHRARGRRRFRRGPSRRGGVRQAPGSRPSRRAARCTGSAARPTGNEILDLLFAAALDAMYEVAPT